MPNITGRRYYATPDPDAHFGVGQLVMRSYRLCMAAGPAGIDDGEPVQTGRITYRPFYGEGQVSVTWADGTEETVDGCELDKLETVRFVPVEARAEVFALEVIPAVLPRFERWSIFYHPSTDASMGYKRNGYADERPDEPEEETEYVDRYDMDRQWHPWKMRTVLRGPACACKCHQDHSDEPPF